MMGSHDDREVHRLCSMLQAVHEVLPESAPFHEALVKGALAIQIAFAGGWAPRIDQMYADLQDPEKDLTPQQLAHLRRLGIDPNCEADSDG